MDDESLMPLDLDALEKVALAATQAPWFRSGGRQDLYDGKRPVNGHGICLEGESQDTIAHVFFDKRTGEGFSDANHIATFDPPTVLNLIALIRALTAERDEAIRQMSAYAREAGEATGRLEMSEAAGIVDGWRERAQAAESALAKMTAERDRLRQEADARERADADYRRRWARHDVLTRIDTVRQNIACLRPGDAEALAELSSRLLHTEAERDAEKARREEVEGALSGIADDYMTSEAHHPGYVLIPTAKFEQLRTVSGERSDD